MFFSKGNGQQVELLDSIVWLVVDTGSGQHTLALVLVVRKNVSKQSSWYLCHWTFKKPNLIGWLILFFNFSLRREMQVCGGSQYAFF